MPTPFELLTDPVSLAFFALYFGLMTWEALFPARALVEAPRWRFRGVTALFAYFFVSSYLPLFVGRLGVDPLVDLTGLGVTASASIALFAYEFFAYWWHRGLHAFDFSFRVAHQMHHAAERVDVLGAFWFGPLDMVGWTMLSTCVLTVFGLAPSAIVAFVLGTAFLGIFQHANVRTPRWLGYLIQRPEAHSRHHERGHHTGNFSDLPLFDLLFGTFENPKDFSLRAGFYEGASERIVDLLLCRDVSRAPVREWNLRAASGSRSAPVPESAP